jgi:SAM-dependent methyltransferase
MAVKKKDPLHEKISEFFIGKSGKVLDAGAGEGELSKALMDLGLKVTSCDVDPKAFIFGKCIKVDLNRNLPFDKGSFDYVVCAEVAEHVENLHQIIREFNRVLKKGGFLAISTPNIAGVFSRLKFLFTGKFWCFSDEERRLGHLNPITWWEMTDALKTHGFNIESIGSNNQMALSGDPGARTRLMRVLARLAYIVLRPVLKPKNPEILKGDSLIFFARKL